jgi:TIR domain/Pentapeptide repeats (8 copies)
MVARDQTRGTKLANDEHLEILQQGVAVWNQWREEHSGIIPDLASIRLCGGNLARANLSDANLSGAFLRDADLENADLSKAILIEANLGEAHLTGARLDVANLLDANLEKAKMLLSSLRRSNLRNVRLFRADLVYADLSDAELSGANFEEANLLNANLSGTDLVDTDLTRSAIGGTNFGNVDLSKVKGLETVNHIRPSSVGIETVYRSAGKIPEVFVRGAGLPENFIVFMHSLVGKAFEFYSCFISHSARDGEFVDRLYADMQANGVRCWSFPEDAKWGESVWGEIDRSIHTYDKLVVVCSANSLQSGPVNREIERALQREDRESRHILFPIRIDGYLFEKWEHPRKADVISKVVGNFVGWEDLAIYRKALDRLLKNLRDDKTE